MVLKRYGKGACLYLLTQYYTQFWNKRTCKYGGMEWGNYFFKHSNPPTYMFKYKAIIIMIALSCRYGERITAFRKSRPRLLVLGAVAKEQFEQAPPQNGGSAAAMATRATWQQCNFSI